MRGGSEGKSCTQFVIVNRMSRSVHAQECSVEDTCIINPHRLYREGNNNMAMNIDDTVVVELHPCSRRSITTK